MITVFPNWKGTTSSRIPWMMILLQATFAISFTSLYRTPVSGNSSPIGKHGFCHVLCRSQCRSEDEPGRRDSSSECTATAPPRDSPIRISFSPWAVFHGPTIGAQRAHPDTGLPQRDPLTPCRSRGSQR